MTEPEHDTRAPFVSLSSSGCLRLHLPHGDGFAVVDLSAENAIKLVGAVSEKLEKLKGKAFVFEILKWLAK